MSEKKGQNFLHGAAIYTVGIIIIKVLGMFYKIPLGNILGDDGVPMGYHESFWKSELIDFGFLQQDGFDPVDSLTPLERQKYMLDLILEICERKFEFSDYEECRSYFKRIINSLRQMNYSKWESEEFKSFRTQLNEILSENGK